ncbi:MAG TPA: VTT domain-containing protein [Symbiobacteriaceae bacterium]
MAELPLYNLLAGLVAGLMEGSGIPFPGGLLLTAAGATTPTLPAASLLATTFSAAYVAGAAAQYYVGAAFGPWVKRLLPPRMRRRTMQILKRYGEVAVLWTRPLVVGNYISIPAGMIRMPMARFVLYTFVGIWPWAFAMALAGTYLGTLLTQLSRWLPHAGLAGTVVALLAGLRWLWLRLRDVRDPDP